MPICAWNFPLISLIFLKRSLVLTLLLFASISLYLSLKKAFLSFLAILWNSAFSWVCFSLPPLLFFFPQLLVKPPQPTLPSCIYFSLGWFCSLPPDQITNLCLQFFRHCLRDQIPWIDSSPPPYIHRRSKSYLTGLVFFPAFFSWRLNFSIRGS